MILYCVWEDAYVDAIEWCEIKDLNALPRLIYTVGFLIEGGDEGTLTLAQMLDYSEKTLAHVINIPLAMIRELDILSKEREE